MGRISSRARRSVRGWARSWVLVTTVTLVTLISVAAYSAGGFRDVDAESPFVEDIRWLSDSGVTKGCNPPENTNYCPDDAVTRAEMAAFLHRLADNEVVAAATAKEALSVGGVTGDDLTLGVEVTRRVKQRLETAAPVTLLEIPTTLSETASTVSLVSFHGYFTISGVATTAADHQLVCWISTTERSEYSPADPPESVWRATYPTGTEGVGADNTHDIPFSLSHGFTLAAGVEATLFLQCADLLGDAVGTERLSVEASAEAHQVVSGGNVRQ